MSSLLLSLLIGGGLGALIGRFGQCSSGACPLTANWKRGAVYGAVIGLVFHLASGGAMGPYPVEKNIKTVTEADFHAEVMQADKPVVVDFFATWCGPCKVLAPKLDKLAGEFGNRIKFVSVNVDKSPALALKYGVQGIPAVFFLGKNGTVEDSTVGLVSAGTLRSKLEALVAASSEPSVAVGQISNY